MSTAENHHYIEVFFFTGLPNKLFSGQHTSWIPPVTTSMMYAWSSNEIMACQKLVRTLQSDADGNQKFFFHLFLILSRNAQKYGLSTYRKVYVLW